MPYFLSISRPPSSVSSSVSPPSTFYQPRSCSGSPRLPRPHTNSPHPIPPGVAPSPHGPHSTTPQPSAGLRFVPSVGPSASMLSPVVWKAQTATLPRLTWYVILPHVAPRYPSCLLGYSSVRLCLSIAHILVSDDTRHKIAGTPVSSRQTRRVHHHSPPLTSLSPTLSPSAEKLIPS